jgi:primosomal protein N'
LFDQFDSQNIIDAEKSVENYIREKNIETIFGNTEDALQMFAERVSPDGSYNHLIEKPNRTPSKPNVTFSPALLLRKRNTQSFTALYEKILENIENGDESLEIPTINDLIGIHPNIEDDITSPDNSFNGSKNEPIFFPKEYNDEQLEIVEKAKRNNKVLVQGPPGTGKSHTIANLICHLLANGKKVLITAYTKRALEVLKDKLPPEFQDLAVNLLSGDSSSIQDLQSSVNAINDELSRANLTQYQSQIDEFENELKKTRELIAETSNSLVKIKEKATRKQEINEKYKGTLTEIAEQLEKDEDNFAWYKDSFKNVQDFEILEDVKKYILEVKYYQNVDCKEYDYKIPETERLISVDSLLTYKNKVSKLSGNYQNKSDQKSIFSQDFEKLKSQLAQLLEALNKVELINLSFKEAVIESYFNNQQGNWTNKIQQTDKILKKIREHDLEQIDRDIEIEFLKKKSLKQLKYDAQILLNFLKEVNAIKDEEDKGRAFAWLCGLAGHIVTDVVIHPVVELKVGTYEGHEAAHRNCEMHQDVYIYKKIIKV